MKLEDLGFNHDIEPFRVEQQQKGFELARVIAEHRERYVVSTGETERDAEITGNIRYTASGREDFPAVGDWVAITPFDSEQAIIHAVYPRKSAITRQTSKQSGNIQMIAANIDYAFLVQAADRDFNINRLERYLTICHASRVNPIVVLTKTDLLSNRQVAEITESIKKRIKNVPVAAISNETHDGYNELLSMIEKGKTFCLLGSSGVGKSTLINNLSGSNHMRTGTISESTGKGRHVTSHRELTVIENGGILIDTPGMREVGITENTVGLKATFDHLIHLAENCKYSDCTHTNEAGCAVLEAVEKGELDPKAYENYLKLERERVHVEATTNERRKKEKAFGKYIKNFKKDIRKVNDKHKTY